jgi:hypothetical protein
MGEVLLRCDRTMTSLRPVSSNDSICHSALCSRPRMDGVHGSRGRRSASSTDPPAGDLGRASRSLRPRRSPRQASGVASRHIRLPHADALELAREAGPLNITQRQPGHANLGATSSSLQASTSRKIIATQRVRRAPMRSASAGLRLRARRSPAGGRPLMLRPDASRRPWPDSVARACRPTRTRERS